MIQILIIYLIGYIIAYYIGRFTMKRWEKYQGLDYEFQNIMLNIFISFASYIAIVCWIFVCLITNANNIFNKTKIPKWL